MLRQILFRRLQVSYISQQTCNVQWVPTVLEATASISPASISSRDHFSTDLGLEGDIVDQQQIQHIPHLRSDKEPALLWQQQQQQQLRSGQTPPQTWGGGWSSPLSTYYSSQPPCVAVGSTVYVQHCQGCHTNVGNSSSSRKTGIQTPKHREPAASTTAAIVIHLYCLNRGYQSRADPATAGCQTSSCMQKPFQQHISTPTSNSAVSHHNVATCSSMLGEARISLSAAVVGSSSHYSTSVWRTRQGNSDKFQHEDDPDSEQAGSFKDTDTHSTASSSKSRCFNNPKINSCGSSRRQHQHTDLRSPASWYPLARAMQRQLIAHVGPTNSGKTHAALTALMAAPSGVYCGPLRLLACEIADRLNAAGVACNLITGQEVRLVRGARHTACTVEMADLEQRVEVAVLDEIQMISDKSRGWSWTRALLGLPAHTLHLCGDPAATDLIAQLAQHCNDQLTVNRCRRLSPLIVEPQALDGLRAVQEGDCVVAFGRKALHKLRKSIIATSQSSIVPDRSDSDEAVSAEGGDAVSRFGVGMVYGALPPEARRTQAALFNAGAHQWPRYSIMVASDAIGMGLNLNIRRIVFASMHKYDGEELRRLTPSEVKQIAGRAGRYGGAHGAAGYVTCLNEEDVPLLREALGTASTQNTHACLLPRFEQLEQFHYSLQHPVPFHKVLSKFAAAAQLSGPYFLADMSNMVSLARVLRRLEEELDLEEMYTWCISPAGADDPAVLQALLTFATLYVEERRVTPHCITSRLTAPPRTAVEMKAAEELFRVYDLYLWLAGRVGPGVFQGQKLIRKQRQQVAELINVALQEMGGVIGSRGWQAGATAVSWKGGRGGAAGCAGRTSRRRRGGPVSRTCSSYSEEDEAEAVAG